MSYKIYIKQFDNNTVLQLMVNDKSTIYDVKQTLRSNGYPVQHLMKSGGFAILTDNKTLNSLQIGTESVLMCLILPPDHYSLIAKQNIFHHTTSSKHECKDGIKCKYYSFCLEYKYNNTKIFNHMISHQHPNHSICRNGGKCYAFQRCIVQNGYRNDDRCHILAFIHPPKINFKQDLLNKIYNPFIYCNYMMKTKLFDLISFPNNNEQIKGKQIAQKLHKINVQKLNNGKSEIVDIKPDYIDFLIHEVVNNGFQHQLFMPLFNDNNDKFYIKVSQFDDNNNDNDDEKQLKHTKKGENNKINLEYKYPSILKIVNEKMNHPQHILYGKPLNYGELLAFILYTDCDCKYDMVQSLLFNKNINKWRWFIYCLDAGIEKLSKYERGEIDLYSFISNYNIPKPSHNEPFMYFATFIDFSWDQQFMQKQYERNNETGTMIKMICEEKRKNQKNGDRFRRIFSGCCDVSWIDKCGKEKKVIFRPFATFYSYKIVKQDQKHNKILLCHGRQINGNDAW